jgi:hypothetical protein
MHALSILYDLNHTHGDHNLHDVISCYHDFTYIYLRALQHKPSHICAYIKLKWGVHNPSLATAVA